VNKLKSLVVVFLVAHLPSFAGVAAQPNTKLHFVTSIGNVDMELYDTQAPITVKNFLNYVDSGFFNLTIFHRVVPGFVVQGGGLTADMQEKQMGPPIKNEAGNGLKNIRGTLSMARTSEVDSATSEFFINLVDNARLDHKDETPAKFGYAVFGKVTEGMDVIDSMQKVETHTVGDYKNVPVTPIVVQSVTRVPCDGENAAK
jgi:peptidyl-prolyl cis-trans isomerase A (cyclophilin A)